MFTSTNVTFHFLIDSPSSELEIIGFMVTFISNITANQKRTSMMEATNTVENINTITVLCISNTNYECLLIQF
jgi:hypothetical protein